MIAALRGTVIATLGALFLAGCASVDFTQSIDRANREAAGFTQGHLALARDEAARSEQGRAVDALLRQPLSSDDAVRIALINSPALQAMLADNWAAAAGAAQAGRLSNPLLTLSRVRIGSEVDIERTLSIGLLELLTLPGRVALAERRIEQTQLALTAAVIDAVTQIRQAWVTATSTRQTLFYAQRVLGSAEASAELARRMQAAGNFTKLERARQQLFYADAATALADARHRDVAARQELIRLLGLTDAQASQLQLPERLPDLPAAPRLPAEVSGTASEVRLDVRLAQAELATAAKAQGISGLSSLTDIELGGRLDTSKNEATGEEATGRGFEIAIRLPLFNWGDMQRDALDAQTLAAANRLEATMRSASSSLRRDYSAYRTAWDVARHYRVEILPLRKTIADENVLRYNGMLIGVFELLADARQQIDAVMAAIDAERRFWIADAALQASIIGKPAAMSPEPSRAAAAMTAGPSH